MDCISPPGPEDRQLLAYLDGDEPDPQVEQHLARCGRCRERAQALAGLQDNLKARLYRVDCPSPVELGDYHLGLLPARQKLVLAAHLRECPHCARELDQLQGFLSVLAPPASGPLEGARVLAARLLGGERGTPLNGEAGLAPAPALLRGDAPGPLTFEVDGALILLDIQPAGEGRLAVLGQVAADQQDLWTGASAGLIQPGAPHRTASVDDLGAFRFDDVQPGRAELRLTPLSGPVVIVDVEIAVQSD